MKKQKIIFLLVSALISSCSSVSKNEIIPENDDNILIMAKNLPFTNLSQDYNIEGNSISTYYINGDDVPYVDVLKYIQSLNGFVNCGKSLRHKYYPNKNMFVLSFYYNDNLNSYAQFHWDTNSIYVSDFDFFTDITSKNQKTNYNSYIKHTRYDSWSEKAVRFNLGLYYFDILYWNEKCLMPFTIANMLFCSQNQFNVYYTEESYYGFYGEIDNGDDAYKTIYTNNSNGKTQSKEMRKATVNSLLFAMDYFYGLKKSKKIKLFKEYISKNDFDLLWSQNADDNFIGLKHIIFNQLDELHTRIDGRSIYSNKHSDQLYNSSDYGEFYNKFYSLCNQQSALRKEKIGESSVSYVRYNNDTAIITFDSFKTGSKFELYDSDGNIKDTAWKYDTYFFMRHCMNDIIKHEEVQDIVLDLSLNGGGNIGAMNRTLGFLTDKVILDYSYNTLTNEYSCRHFKIDTDGDGYYDDDAYNQYRWTILSSMNSFSAANSFICKVKQQNLAKIIGNKSGGGMCSVLPLVLADGTAIAISSNNSNRFVVRKDDGDIYYSIENGIEPDMEIPYGDYYDNSKIEEYVDAVYSKDNNR